MSTNNEIFCGNDDDDGIDSFDEIGSHMHIDDEDEGRMDLGFVASGLTRLKDIVVPDKYYNRYYCGIEEVDHLFGGGVLPGSVITCAAVGGVGKTTFWLQALAGYQNHGLNVGLYSGEESKEQLAYRSTRLNVADVPVANEKQLEVIIDDIKTGLNFVVIDSFQSLTCESTLRGARLQQHMVNMIMKAAQENDCAVAINMHVTKAGILKGNTCVPHTVDVNLIIRNGYKEYGDKNIRILDIPTKNRNGPLTEALALMTQSGYSYGVEVEPVGDAVAATNKRSNKKQAEMQQILDLDTPVLTAEIVMDALDVDYNYAYGRLAELNKNKKLNKIGKGQDAIFTKP